MSEERLIIDIFKDTPSQVSPYLFDTEKVAECDVTNLSIDHLGKILKIQDILGRRWKTRRICCVD